MRERQFDVVVVGAGAAGLYAAALLTQRVSFLKHPVGVKPSVPAFPSGAPLRVKVLEATGRIGGRIYTQPDVRPRSASSAFEAGAGIVHNSRQLFNYQLERRGVAKHPIAMWAPGDGGPIEPESKEEEQRHLRLVRGGRAYYYFGRRQQLLRQDDVDDEFWNVMESVTGVGDMNPALYPPDYQFKDYLRDEANVRSRSDGLVAAGFNNTVGNKMSTSLTALIRSEARWGEQEDEEQPFDQFLAPGVTMLEAFVQPLARGLDVSLHSPVVRVDYTDPRRCVVVTARGELYSAPCVLVTAPVDADIHYSPPMPAPQRRNLQSLPRERGIKAALWFSRRFWPADFHGCICADSPIPEVWSQCFPLSYEPRRPQEVFVLYAFIGSTFADDLMGLPDAQIRRVWLEQLDRMFGKPEGTAASLAVGEMCIQRWAPGFAPFNQYMYCSPSTPRQRLLASTPLGGDRVFFAGEALADSPGSIQSALQTALRESRQIVHALSRRAHRLRCNL